MDFINLSISNKPYEAAVKAAVDRVLASGHFIGGPEVKGFEIAFAKYLDIDHVVTCASGTDALFLALKALGIGPGDEVIIPSFTYVATANTVTHLGGVPVFCDVDEKTFNIDCNSAATKITDRTKAIIAVHMFGQSADMDAVNALAAKHNLFVIEDAAQSTGGTFNGKQTGTMGTIGCFSFFPTKNIGCYGDGGAIATNDEALAARISKLKHQGQSKKYHHELLGHNSRLDALQAAILSEKLPHLDDEIAARRERASLYPTELPDVEHPYTDPRCKHSFNQYTVLVDNRDAYQHELMEEGVPTMVYYPVPLHLQPCFSYLAYKEGDLPISESLCKRVLSFPIFN